MERAPAGAGTAAAVGKYREGSCWSRHYCGSEENSWGGTPMVAWGCWEGERERAVVGGGWEGGGWGNGEGRGREEKRLLLERALLRQWEKQIALQQEQTLLRQWGNTDSAPEGSSHYCGSEEIQVLLLREQSLLRRGEIQKRLLREQSLLRQWGNTEKAPAGADTAAAVRKKQLGGLCGRVTERRGCYGVSEVYSKGDGRLGSGGLPCCGSGLIGYSFWKLLTTSDRVLGSAVGKGLCGPLWLLHLFGMNGGGS